MQEKHCRYENIIVIIIIQLNSLFIHMLTQEPKGQLQSKHQQCKKQNDTQRIKHGNMYHLDQGPGNFF
jgi:hypothetical protein